MEVLILGLLLYVLVGGVALAASSTGLVTEQVEHWKLLAGLAAAGAILGVGKLLASDERLSLRLVLGRAIVSGGLAVGAGSILAFIEGLHVLALCGFAAVCAVLGEQFIERIIQDRLKK